MCTKIKVPYVSEWDDGTTIETSAYVNIKTGEVTDMEVAEASNTLNSCERKYVVMNDEVVDVISKNDSYWVPLDNSLSEGLVASDNDDSQLQISLTEGVTLSVVANDFADNKSIQIRINYPDGNGDCMCSVEYDTAKDLLQTLVYARGGGEGPVFSKEYAKKPKSCPHYIESKLSAYPLCDNPKCLDKQSCCISAHMRELE